MAVVSTFQQLCNDFAAGCFEGASRKVDFEALSKIEIQPIGIFGWQDDVWAALSYRGTFLQTITAAGAALT